MKVTNIRREDRSDAAQVVGTVAYEDSDRGPLEVFYEVPREFASDLVANPDSFLLACVLPARRHGERRLLVEGDVCPRLRQGVVTALHWMRHWYGREAHPIALEVRPRSRTLPSRGARHTGLFFSGGVDSLAALRGNRLGVPLEHPASIRDGIMVNGFNPLKPASVRAALVAAQTVARAAGMTLIPVTTNARGLEPDGDFWTRQFHGAVLGSVAHALAGRVNLVHLASSYDIPHLVPWGSHPALDYNFSSHDVAVYHDGCELSRLDKTRLVAGWDVGLQQIHVCTREPEGALNCGRCEKCVRTMLMLLALGALDKTTAFGGAQPTVESIRPIYIRSRYQELCYQDVREPLRQHGHPDLADAVQHALDEYHRYQDWVQERGWKGAIKRWDRRLFGSALSRARSRGAVTVQGQGAGLR